MSDQEDISKFPHPLNQDVVEQVPVEKIAIDFDEKGRPQASVKTVMQKQTVRYIHVPKSRIRCPAGQHIFRVYNMQKYLFACTKCPFVRKVFPTTYRFDEATGKLIHRITGQAV